MESSREKSEESPPSTSARGASSSPSGSSTTTSSTNIFNTASFLASGQSLFGTSTTSPYGHMPSAFSMFGTHPFQFGGLGMLGTPGSLSPTSGADWWRQASAHARTMAGMGAGFFPGLAMPPTFGSIGSPPASSGSDTKVAFSSPLFQSTLSSPGGSLSSPTSSTMSSTSGRGRGRGGRGRGRPKGSKNKSTLLAEAAAANARANALAASMFISPPLVMEKPKEVSVIKKVEKEKNKEKTPKEEKGAKDNKESSSDSDSDISTGSDSEISSDSDDSDTSDSEGDEADKTKKLKEQLKQKEQELKREQEQLKQQQREALLRKQSPSQVIKSPPHSQSQGSLLLPPKLSPVTTTSSDSKTEASPRPIRSPAKLAIKHSLQQKQREEQQKSLSPPVLTKISQEKPSQPKQLIQQSLMSTKPSEGLAQKLLSQQKSPSQLTQEQRAKEEEEKLKQLKLQFEQQIKQQQQLYKLQKRAQALSSPSSSSSTSAATNATSKLLATSKSAAVSSTSASQSKIIHPQTFKLPSSSPSTSKGSDKKQKPLVARFRGVAEESSDSDSGDDSDDDDEDDSDSDDDDDDDDDSSETSESAATPTKSSETPSPTKSVKRAADVAMPNNLDDGFRKRRRIIDLREVRIPLEHGWRRETRIRAIGPGGGIKGDVCYLAPCGKKLRTYPEVQRYLDRCGITDLTRENFSFSPKTNIGDFIECRNGANGTEYVLLTEEQILQRTRDGVRRGRPPSSDKLKKRDDRKVEQQEFARKAVEMRMKRKMEQQALVSAEMAKRVQEAKLRRKIEKQAQVQAAKEAKRQQAMMAAEEKRRQKERIKLLKQQEKMQRLEQIRMEKEMKAQQIMEERQKVAQQIFMARKKRKELQDKQRLEEAMKKAKEREMRRQQQVMLKNQEKERRRQLLFLERERRKQHMMLVRALEARKKAEERERMKQEKKVEKKLTRERKMEQRRLELQIAKELKKPVEDMQLKEAKPLPTLKRIPGMQLPGNAFADCMMVFEFLHNFGSVLDMDEKDIPTLDEMQQGLLGEEEAEREVLDMLANLLQCALRDPGVIPGMQSATVLRVPLHDADIDHRNLSEILRLFIQGRNGFQDEMSQRLETIPFQAHSPTQKAAILAFICNELLCSRAVVGEIDSSIEHMSNLRRDKWIVEGKLRKLRIIRAKKFHRPYSRQGMSNENSNMGEDSNMSGTMSVANTPGKASSKGDEDSKMEEDEEEDEDKDDEEEDGEGLDVEGEDEAEPESVEETERRIEKLSKQQSQYRSKLFDASHSLRALCLGQDRYHRRYWVLPCAGGVFVEGMESAEPENMEVDKENSHPQESKDNVIPKEAKENSTDVEDVKKEEETVVKSENNVETAKQNGDQNCGNHDSKAVEETKASAMSQGASENLFLQKPSKLSELLDVAKQDPDSCPTGTETRTSHDATAATSTPQQVRIGGLQAQKSGSGFLNIDTLVNRTDMKLGTYMSPLPSSIQFAPGPLTADQLLKGLTHKMNGDGMWFSVLPRMPCDETSLTRLQLPSVGNVESSKTSPSGPPQGAGVQNSAFSHPQVKSAQTGFGFTTFGQSPLSAQQVNALYAQRMPGPSTSAYQPNFLGMAPNMWMGMNEVEPAPIPKEMVRGWWQMLESEQIRALLKVLHPRGIRERILQKSLQKYNDYACQCCKKARENDAIKLEEVEDDKTPRDPSGAPLETWKEQESEDLAYKFEVSLLQDVEDLEERVFQASLQVKGWKLPPRMTADYADKSIEDSDLQPLELAQKRLASLEMNLERRYIKPPLSKNVQISLATMGFPEENSNSSTPPNSSDEDIPNALRVWRDVVTTETTAPAAVHVPGSAGKVHRLGQVHHESVLSVLSEGRQ
ncbi:bromodomain adjacent to zinc finger domain protein 2B-like isoform X6 [Branchiostoma floridae x Branchiostoma japonicum]